MESGGFPGLSPRNHLPSGMAISGETSPHKGVLNGPTGRTRGAPVIVMRGSKTVFWGLVLFIVLGMGGGLYYILKSQQESLIPEEAEPVSIVSEISLEHQALIESLKEKIRSENPYYIIYDFPIVEMQAPEKKPIVQKSQKKGK